MGQLAQLQSQQLSMQAALSQMQSSGPSAEPPPYPEQVVAEAVAALGKDARLPAA